MSASEDSEHRSTSARAASGPPGHEPGGGGAAQAAELATRFRAQVERALQTTLHDGEVSLAYVDHYLRLAATEEREPILWLLAAGAGAYFGELIRREIGATWAGDGKEPRLLRLLLEPQLIHLAPIDIAFAAITGASDEETLDRLAIDTAFHIIDAPDPDAVSGQHLATTHARATTPGELAPLAREDADPRDPIDDDDVLTGDAEWIRARLEETPPLAVDQFVSLTGRFETLRLILGLLAARHAAQGRSPQSYGLTDYLGRIGRNEH